MKKILIVEDSEMVVKVLRHLIAQYPQYHPIFATSMTQAQTLIYEHSDIFAALVDINLPDAPDGEVVDYVLAKKIPAIVLTGIYDDAHRELLFNKGIVDYVTKEGRFAYNQAIGMIQRLEKNQQIKVLVVDDSDISLKHMGDLLRRHLFQVKEAVNGMDAIKVLLENPDIKLLITDYNMPRMDGFELVKNLRYKYEKTNLIIIGVSGESNEALSAKFIKQGANDFLRKPFHPEEFYCRIIQNFEYLEMNDKIKDAAERDSLTHLYHRQYFFNAAKESYNHAQEKSLPLALAVINVDNFKDINEKYGNEWGDYALKFIAKELHTMLNRFLLCRADGDNFFAMMPGLDNEKAEAFLSSVRHIISTKECLIDGKALQFYLSIGVTNNIKNGVDAQIRHATRLMCLAKGAGGNMVLGDEDEEVD